MRDSIRKQSDEEQDPREEFVVKYQEETPLEIQDIQLEVGMPRDTSKKNFAKIHRIHRQSFWAHCSIVARNYLDNHFPNWEKKALPTKAKNFKSASGKMTSIGAIIKEIIIPHRKGKIRLNPELVVLNDAHIQGLLLGTDYHRMYGIDIYNSKNRRIAIGTNKEKKFSGDIHQISAEDQLKGLLN
ncbi:hypothetical protein O181_010935 [Austropuccinia psidii MF-1]|uniref:Uncharacterized protein n=1 Tax=Austropuccinia psidii MF-1 TaxID=1389203 RepID=A0A9Q3GLE7_9BASI|nr:hypothetical protein [Austropuccinia psidii MF-1]